MESKRTPAVRIRVLILFGIAGFILGTNYGCSYFTLFKDHILQPKGKCAVPTASSEPDHEDLFAEKAEFTRNQRLRALHKCCSQERNRRAAKSENNPFANVIVDRKHRFLYCIVPKVASTNMRRLILTLQGEAEHAEAIGQFDRLGFEFLHDLGASERDHVIKTYFKFMFVRHPLERLVSAYRHRILTARSDLHGIYAEKIVKKYRNLTNASPEQLRRNDVTFREFIKYVLDQKNNEKLNPHWRPFLNLCHPCHIPYDFIGSMKYIEQDVAALLEKLNASRKISFPKKQAHYQTLSKTNALLYYRNVTSLELDRLRKKYDKDFTCFLYPREFQIRALPADGKETKNRQTSGVTQ